MVCHLSARKDLKQCDYTSASLVTRFIGLLRARGTIQRHKRKVSECVITNDSLSLFIAQTQLTRHSASPD